MLGNSTICFPALTIKHRCATVARGVSLLAMRASFFAVFVALAACHSSAAPVPDGPPPTTCNGHAELCERAYNRVAFAGTHDAYANRAENFVAADQSYPLAKQLEDGVRVLHLEALTNLPNHEDAYLCHGLCGLGNKLLADDLTDVKSFVTAHPAEVVTLLVESRDLPTDTIAAAFTKSGLVPSLHAQDLGDRDLRARHAQLHVDLTRRDRDSRARSDAGAAPRASAVTSSYVTGSRR